uniref:Uncharacterized protein n=1 Tax=Syphacia muris TaxID=451379 RepID=A0A0N5APF5_9BILA
MAKKCLAKVKAVYATWAMETISKKEMKPSTGFDYAARLMQKTRIKLTVTEAPEEDRELVFIQLLITTVRWLSTALRVVLDWTTTFGRRSSAQRPRRFVEFFEEHRNYFGHRRSQRLEERLELHRLGKRQLLKLQNKYGAAVVGGCLLEFEDSTDFAAEQRMLKFEFFERIFEISGCDCSLQ